MYGNDLIGRKFARLTAVRQEQRRPTKWLFQCDCGNRLVVPPSWVTKGNTRSCGCLKVEGFKRRATTHGLSKTRAYKIWIGMRSRVDNPNCAYFDRYGGRGITYEKRWEVFANFYEDMGDPPPSMSLDRIDNDGPYSKINCRWATAAQQARNRSTTKIVSFNGVDLALEDWASLLGIGAPAMLHRLRKFGVDTALTMRNRYKSKTALQIMSTMSSGGPEEEHF